MGKMKRTGIVILVAIVAVFILAVALVSASARPESQDQFDAAATYNSKCVACHGAKADKKFDAAKADAEHVQAILKGKKMEKPPNMPGYEEKGVTEDQAKALLAYMRSAQQ